MHQSNDNVFNNATRASPIPTAVDAYARDMMWETCVIVKKAFIGELGTDQSNDIFLKAHKDSQVTTPRY